MKSRQGDGMAGHWSLLRARLNHLAMVPALLLAGTVQAALPKMPEIEGVTADANPVAVFQGLFNLIVNLVLIVLAVMVVLVVALQVIREVNEARREDGKWGRAFTTAVGGAAVILFVIYLANFAGEIIA